MRQVAVSNTGPLIALAQANLLSMLNALFERVMIPEAVRGEIDAGSKPAIRFNEMSSRCKVLRVEPDPQPNPLLSGVLDHGEAAVILLAQEAKPDITLLDERKGRKVAADVYHLKVIGTAGLLLRAKRQGIINEVRPPMDQMIASGYFLHDRIREHVLRLAGENP